MLGNALIRRYRYSALRPRQLWIYITIYVTIVAVMFYINYTAYKYQQLFDSLTDLSKALYFEFLLLGVLVLWIWAASNSASAIRDEISENSFDFFRMLPLAAYKKAIGILVGKNLLALLLTAVNCVLLLAFGLAGKINPALQGQIFVVLFSVAILANSNALLLSICRGRKRKRGNWLGLIFLAVFVVPYIIAAVMELGKIKGLESFCVSFFRLKIPILMLISYIALYFSCWTIVGIIRKFNHEGRPLFSRPAAVLFLLGYQVIVTGLFFSYLAGGFLSHLSVTRTPLDLSCWLILLLPVLLIPFGSLRSFDSYLEYSGLIQSGANPRGKPFWRILVFSNLSACLALFVMWIGSVAATLIIHAKATNLTESELLRCLYFVFVILSFYLFLLLLLELYVLYRPGYSKIGLLLGFLAVLYLFLPLILTAILESEIIYFYSPLGFIAGNVFKSEDITFSLAASIFLINALLWVIPANLIYKRYVYLLTVRREM